MKKNKEPFIFFKTPRGPKTIKKSTFVWFHVFFIAFSAFSVFDLPLDGKEILDFLYQEREIRVSSYTFHALSSLSVPIFYLAALVAMIRNNPKYQPVESFLILLSAGCAGFFIFLGIPAMFAWAVLNGYHLDHFEHERRGGWYIFKLNGT